MAASNCSTRPRARSGKGEKLCIVGDTVTVPESTFSGELRRLKANQLSQAGKQFFPQRFIAVTIIEVSVVASSGTIEWRQVRLAFLGMVCGMLLGYMFAVMSLL